MKVRKDILSAAVLSASVGFGASTLFAQSVPGSSPSMPGGQERSGPTVPQQEPSTPQVPPTPRQPTPGLPETEPMPGQPGTIPERAHPPQAGDTRDMAVTSEDIKKAQEALKAQGLNPGTEGRMDAQTQQALRQFQQANDLPVTGVLDEKTAEKLGVNLGADGRSTIPGSSSPSSSGPSDSGSSSSSPSSGGSVQ